MPSDDTIGVGGDYTTISSWEDSLGALSGEHIGRCLNQTFDEQVTIAGQSGASASNYVVLTVQDGMSFSDDDTNPLRIDATLGAALIRTVRYLNVISVNTDYTKIRRLMIRNSANDYGRAIKGDNNKNIVVAKCVIEGPEYVTSEVEPENCVLIHNPVFSNRYCYDGINESLKFCTLVQTTDRVPPSGVLGVRNRYISVPLLSNAVFGFPISYQFAGFVAGDSGGNATDNNETIDPATDTPNVPYSATSPFVQADAGSALDFKLADGSPLIGIGRPAASFPTDDIFSNPRDPANPCVGAHEFVGAPAVSENAIFFGTNF